MDSPSRSEDFEGTSNIYRLDAAITRLGALYRTRQTRVHTASFSLCLFGDLIAFVSRLVGKVESARARCKDHELIRRQTPTKKPDACGQHEQDENNLARGFINAFHTMNRIPRKAFQH